MVMISFLARTSIRLNGWLSDRLSLGAMSAKRASAWSQAMKVSMASRGPARNMLMPSGASRIVPLRPAASQRARISGRRVSMSSSVTNL
ncbi:hypothetical protein D3C86_1653380 [compost metagenome]